MLTPDDSLLLKNDSKKKKNPQRKTMQLYLKKVTLFH